LQIPKNKTEVKNSREAGVVAREITRGLELDVICRMSGITYGILSVFKTSSC
jgi:hypothetical protein